MQIANCKFCRAEETRPVFWRLDLGDFALPDDVKKLAVPALAHRLLLNPDLWARRTTTTDVLEGILQTTPVPKVD